MAVNFSYFHLEMNAGVTYRIYSNKRRPRISAASGTKKLISAALE